MTIYAAFPTENIVLLAKFNSRKFWITVADNDFCSAAGLSWAGARDHFSVKNIQIRNRRWSELSIHVDQVVSKVVAINEGNPVVKLSLVFPNKLNVLGWASDRYEGQILVERKIELVVFIGVEMCSRWYLSQVNLYYVLESNFYLKKIFVRISKISLLSHLFVL